MVHQCTSYQIRTVHTSLTQDVLPQASHTKMVLPISHHTGTVHTRKAQGSGHHSRHVQGIANYIRSYLESAHQTSPGNGDGVNHTETKTPQCTPEQNGAQHSIQPQGSAHNTRLGQDGVQHSRKAQNRTVHKASPKRCKPHLSLEGAQHTIRY